MGAGAPPPASASTRAAASRTVGASNSARSGSSTPHASRMRPSRRVATSEWPPRSKKLSSHPTDAMARTSDHRRCSFASVAVAGGVTARAASGGAIRASASRSTFPFGVRGNAAIGTNAAGTMYSGSRARR